MEGRNPRDQLRYHLHSLLAHYEPARGIGAIHASAVTKDDPEFCPREYALLDLTGREPRDDFVTTAQQVTYSLGHMVQDRVTRWLRLSGMAVGNWQCSECDHVATMCKRPDSCAEPRCGGGIFNFVEPRFTSRISGASCGVDVLVDLPTRDRLVVVEVKSLMKEEFKRLVMPLAEHRTRTSFYLRIIKEADPENERLIDVDEARILYVAKGGWGMQDTDIKKWGLRDGPWSPFKEYAVESSRGLTRSYHERALAVKKFRDRGPMPSGICPTQFCKRGKFCPVAADCFSGEYPAGEKVKR